MGSASIRRYGEFVRGLFDILKDEPDGLQAKDAIGRLAQRLTLTDFEKDEYPSTPGVRRFDKLVRFATIPAVKAGWLLKEKGTWVLTDEGREALRTYPDPRSLYTELRLRYKRWEDDRPEVEAEVPAEDEEAGEEASASVTVDEAEEEAWKEIDAYLHKMNPYEFQKLVGGLLTGMGYHVNWIAPPGKDGGVDILAYRDPLGAEPPRIKVQVKRVSSKVDLDGVKSFLSVLGDQDVGLYVSLGGFTKDAEDKAREQEKRQVTLIGPKQLLDLWVRYYEKIPEGKRSMLPLKPVWFLAPVE